MDWLYYILLLILVFVGLFINLLGLPGLWLIVLSALVYDWITHWTHVGLGALIALVVLAAIAEVLEFIAGAAGAKKAGGGRLAMWSAIVGALLGGFFLSFLVPIPIVGTVVGVCLGAFLGAAIAQFTVARDAEHSVRVGVGAAKGRFLGIVVKSTIGFLMLLLTAIFAFPLSAKPTLLPAPPATAPATTPATLPTAAAEPA
jgi:uncharacterized protein YqgC (DUF456 family)